jgi:hypothetical protein
MSRFGPVLLLLLGLSGCPAGSSQQALREALDEYNDGLRWGRSEWMARHVANPKLLAQLQRQLDSGNVEITGCEIREVTPAGKDQVLATVRVEWYLRAQGRVFNSTVQQRWRRTGDRWLVVDQHVINGRDWGRD